MGVCLIEKNLIYPHKNSMGGAKIGYIPPSLFGTSEYYMKIDSPYYATEKYLIIVQVL